MNLQRVFFHPPAEFRQAPFWFWNHDLDKTLLTWQIDQMEEKGLGGFVMHARHGLITPYLSDKWMEHIRLGCEEAKRRGMIAWAYDERDWPSGPAGGLTIQDPANRLHYLRWETAEVQGPASITLENDVIAAYWSEGCAAKGCRRASIARIALPAEGERMIEAPAGTRQLLKAIQFECPAILWFESYLDTLNPEACQAFIQSTYDYHEQQLGNLKTLGLAGFFTDEPAFSTYPDDLGRIPWTPQLPEAFLKEKGYDLIERLPDLFSPGDAGAQVRYDYWDVATAMFERAFFQPISQWCEQRGLRMIGHPLGEEPLLYQFRCLGSIFKYLKHEHMPGLDHLTITVGKDSPISMSPKMVVSAALLAGRERIMTETFGESGWGLTLREMKWMADWQMAHGVNYFIPHAFYYSVSRRRKKDSPPSEFFQAPHWPYYRLLADHTARITAVMTGGEHVAKIALFYPMSSVWADFVPGPEITPVVGEMESSFAPLGETLLRLHRDFVVVDEESLRSAVVEDGKLKVNGLTFEALVLPPMTSLCASSVAIIRAMAAQGVVVSVGNDTLRVLQGAPNASLSIAQLQGTKNVPKNDEDALAAALESVPPDVRIENAADVYYLHRRKEEKDLFFFANTGDAAADALVSLEAIGAAEFWDSESGESMPAPGQRLEQGRLTFPLHLDLAGSRLIVVDTARPPVDYPEIVFQPERRMPICGDIWHFTPYNGNFLTLKDWRFSAEMQHKVTELRYVTEFILTEHIANLRLILDGVPEHPYGVPEAARPIVAGETYSTVCVDDKPLGNSLPWEIDPHFRVLDMNHLVPGRHQLEIIIKNQGWFPQPGIEEYAWLSGDFMIDKADGLPHLCPCRGVKIGPWEKQGYPFFSGTAAYATSFDAPDDIVGKRLFLHTGKVGGILDVEVNGRTAGVRAWPPYRVEVTNRIWPGQPNLVILKVTNTLRNLFEGPDPKRPSGLLDEIWLEIG